jgi:hypothetical protein
MAKKRTPPTRLDGGERVDYSALVKGKGRKGEGRKGERAKGRKGRREKGGRGEGGKRGIWDHLDGDELELLARAAVVLDRKEPAEHVGLDLDQVPRRHGRGENAKDGVAMLVPIGVLEPAFIRIHMHAGRSMQPVDDDGNVHVWQSVGSMYHGLVVAAVPYVP